MSAKRNFKLPLVGILAILCGLSALSPAQDVFAPTGIFAQPAQAVQVVPMPALADQPQEMPRLAGAQIDEMMAPIALYPDPLLAQVLPASTYPGEIVQAAQWLANNPQFDEAALDAQPWEPSVKALVHYPVVLQTMYEHMDWTQALGAAFLVQQDDMMDSIQRLRLQARAAGTLVSNDQQQVLLDDGVIEILPPTPEIIYVPVYDPQVVYVETAPLDEPFISFDFVYRTGSWLDNGCDWHRRWIARGGGWHCGWRFEGQNWQRDTRPVIVGNARFSSVRSLSDRYARAALNPWSHNATKPRPALSPTLVSRALANSRTGSFVRGRTDNVTANRLATDRRISAQNPWSAHVPPSLARSDRTSPLPVTAQPSTVRPNPFVGTSQGQRARADVRPPAPTTPAFAARTTTPPATARPAPAVTDNRGNASSTGRPTIYWPKSSNGQTPRTFNPPTVSDTPRTFTPPAVTPRTFTPPTTSTPRTFTPPTTSTPRTFTPPPASTPRTFTPPATSTPRTFTPPPASTPRTFTPPATSTPRTFTPPTASTPRTFTPPTTSTPRTFTPPATSTPRTFTPPATSTPRTFTPPTTSTPRTFTPPPTATPRSFSPSPSASRSYTPSSPPAGRQDSNTSSNDRGRTDSGNRNDSGGRSHR